MLRPFAFELVLFALPFLGYMLWLIGKGRPAFAPDSWPQRTLAILIIGAMVSMLVGLALFGHFRGAPANSVYVPAHLENGKLVAPELK